MTKQASVQRATLPEPIDVAQWWKNRRNDAICPTETLRRALCRDARGNATGPLGVALDAIARQS